MPPVDYFKPLNSLRNLPGSGFKPYSNPMDDESVASPLDDSGVAQLHPDENANSDLDLLTLQNQRRDELTQNAAKGLIQAAPGNSLHELNSDIASNPITQQGNEINDFRNKQHEAQLAGFSGPQEAAGYGRQMERTKIESPQRVAETTGGYNLKEQELKNTGAANVANIGARSAEGKLTALQSLLAGGIKPGQHVSVAGVGSIGESNGTQPKPIPSPLLAGVQKAREAVTKSGGGVGAMFGITGGQDRAKANLTSAIANALSQHPASQGIKSTAQEIAKHPKLSKMPIDQLLKDPSIDLSDATPEEINQLGDLLGIIRGF